MCGIGARCSEETFISLNFTSSIVAKSVELFDKPIVILSRIEAKAVDIDHALTVTQKSIESAQKNGYE